MNETFGFFDLLSKSSGIERTLRTDGPLFFAKNSQYTNFQRDRRRSGWKKDISLEIVDIIFYKNPKFENCRSVNDENTRLRRTNR
jgi:hypothetical protein